MLYPIAMYVTSNLQSNCYLTVPTAITSHPPPAIIVFSGLNVTLSCEATGSVPIRYQWGRVNGEISSDRTEGVNTPTLTISSVTEQDEDKYYCVASNGGMTGSLYNNASQISVIIVYGELIHDITLIHFSS